MGFLPKKKCGVFKAQKATRFCCQKATAFKSAGLPQNRYLIQPLMFTHFSDAVFATKQMQKKRKTLICVMQRHQKPLTSALFPKNSKAKGRGKKSSHQSSSKKHFLIMLLWPFIVPHSDWHCFRELCREARRTYLVLHHLRVSPLFSVLSSYQIESTMHLN